MAEAHLDTLVVLTSGKQDRGTRATLAFSWACTALAMGKPTAIFLTMEGTIWSHKNCIHGVQVDGFEPLEEYLEQLRALGGRIWVCAPCSEYYCSYDREKMSEVTIEGIEITGLTTVVGAIQQGTTVVTF